MAAAKTRTAKKKPVRKAAKHVRRKMPATKAKPSPKAKTKTIRPPTPAAPRRPAPRRQDPVDESSDESFPASDPPSWTPVTGEEG